MSSMNRARPLVKRRGTRTLGERVKTKGSARSEWVAGEEPLEIRINRSPLAVAMRTPGADFPLVAGYLLSEGVIRSAEDIAELRYCDADPGTPGERSYNIINAVIPGADGSCLPTRGVVTTSACGVCGTRSIDEIRKRSHAPLPAPAPMIDQATLLALPDLMRATQSLFDDTGGVHAAALVTPEGRVVYTAEDVGRHNAVDKVIGQALLAGDITRSDTVLQVSGRASFELVQKCVMAGIPILSAVSAPSSLACDLADEAGVTLVGFNRGNRATVYTHHRRIIEGGPAQ